MIALFMQVTGLSKLVSMMILYGAITATAGIALTWYTTHWFNRGWHAHEAKVEKDNAERRSRADEAARNFDACIAANGVWDTTEGKCRGQ